MYGRQFRCSWYREYLTWSDRDQVSGGYAISRSILSNGGGATVASMDARAGGSSKGRDNSNRSSIVNSIESGSGSAVGRLANTSSTRRRFMDPFHEWIPITTPYSTDSSHAMPSNTTSHRRYLSSRHRESAHPVTASRPVAPIRSVEHIPSPYVRILPVSFHW